MFEGDIRPRARGDGSEEVARELRRCVSPCGGWGSGGQDAETIGLQVIGSPALVGEDGGNTTSEGLGHDHTEGFVGGWVDKDVDLAEENLWVGAAEELGALRQCADEFSWQRLRRATSNEHGPGGIFAVQVAEDFEGFGEAFAFPVTAHETEDAGLAGGIFGGGFEVGVGWRDDLGDFFGEERVFADNDVLHAARAGDESP